MDTTTQRMQRLGKDIIATSSLTTLALLIVLNVCQVSRGNPVFVDNPSLAQFQSGRNIRHLPCIVRKSGMSGVCMFAIDCIKQNGTHLGTCIDRFYFGSCCQMKDESQIFAEEISDNSIDQNTISHFSHESTTQLSTNALFKAPTESLIESLVIRNHSTIHPYVQVSTITHMAPKVESTTIKFVTTSRLPTASITMTTTTTSTTPTPTPTSTTTSAPPPTTTTIKTPTRRRPTTTTAPILTIAPNTSVENDFEPTTLPSKFTTFQMVETSTPIKQTEPTITDEVQFTTTMRIPSHSQRPTTDSPPLPPRTKKPIITKIPAANFTTTQSTERPASRTTPKYKPTLVKRPTTTKKPFQANKRPVTSSPTTTTSPTITTPKTKYTRKPVTNHEVYNSTTSSPTRNESPTTTVKVTPLSPEPPTRAPRPKPKPTSEIFKITLPTAPTNQKAELTTTRTRPPTSTVPSTTPSTTYTTTPISTTSETERSTQSPPSTASTFTTSTVSSTPSSTTTIKVESSSSATSSPTVASTTTTSKPSSTVEHFPEPTSTYRPTLVTWTTVDDNKNNTHITIEETDWQPKPPPADWVPVPTIDPEVAANKNTTLSETPSDSTTEGVKKPSLTETNKIPEIISSTTESVVLDLSSTSSAPEAPAVTEGFPTSSSPVISSTSPTTSAQTSSTSSTTERSSENVTESLIPEVSTDMLTEDFNSTTAMPFSTTSAIPSLEGVDYRQVCGRRMFPEPRIVGGSNAAFGRWPWQISLRQWRTSTYLHKCGAALLNENWAITAAHCVDNVPPSDLLLRLGEYDLAEEEEPYGYQERRVQIVASHPQFDPRTFEYDLALLRFYEPVVFQPNIIPVCVPGSDEDFIGQTAFVTGWGRLYEDGPLPSVLQEVAVPIINNTICETMYRAAGYIEHIPHIFICAGWKKGGYDSCEGDSGGPMVLQREMDKRFILGGVISWGIGCAEPNQPGVYTRISEFRDWINQILQF